MSLRPKRWQSRISLSNKGAPSSGTIGFGAPPSTDCNRVPIPPAIMAHFMRRSTYYYMHVAQHRVDCYRNRLLRRIARLPTQIGQGSDIQLKTGNVTWPASFRASEFKGNFLETQSCDD